jgi:hypothetical protein
MSPEETHYSGVSITSQEGGLMLKLTVHVGGGEIVISIRPVEDIVVRKV